MKKIVFVSFFVFMAVSLTFPQNNPMAVKLPDGRLEVKIRLTDMVYHNFEVDGQQVTWYCPLSMQTTESGWLGKTPGLIRSSIRSVAEVIKPQYGITSQINND